MWSLEKILGFSVHCLPDAEWAIEIKKIGVTRGRKSFIKKKKTFLLAKQYLAVFAKRALKKILRFCRMEIDGLETNEIGFILRRRIVRKREWLEDMQAVDRQKAIEDLYLQDIILESERRSGSHGR